MSILLSDHPTLDIPAVSITDHVLRHAERLRDKPAFIEGPTGRVLTYGQLADQVRALAGGLAARGVGSTRPACGS